jgi:cell shape-determining protein MreC
MTKEEKKEFNRREAIEQMLKEKRSTLKQVELHKQMLENEIPHLEELLTFEPKLEVING